MARSVMRTLLVVGDEHEKLAARYSLDTIVPEYVKHRYSDAPELRRKRLSILKDMMESGLVNMTETERYSRRDEYLSVKNMDDFEHFIQICKGCRFDENTFDAYSKENPDAKYKYEKCYQERFKRTGEEAPFSNPFKLVDGSESYSARVGEIDWKEMHMKNTELYKRVFEMCVNGAEPKSDYEKEIRDRMSNRQDYFSNFEDSDEYARHSCSFWCYGVIDVNGKYHEPDLTITDKEWVAGFYDKFIKPLNDNTLLTIYEVRSLND